MELSTKATKIARLVDKVLKTGIAGRALADRVHDVLIEYVRQNDQVELSGDDCPENDPNCDPPGGDVG